ncbi:MAG TPA: hypothetical protein VKE23_12345 [Candidatus Limnocylindria bacterium]|nr:hypothetical protein [Candidatus Limnocylindria bacterium]
MRPLRVAIFGLIVLGIVSVRADTWPWPAVGAQARHSTGIVLLGPIDYNAKFESFPDSLRKAWNDAYTLADEVYPDDFGRPWMDLTTDDVVVSAATANGVEIARQWVQSGLRVASPKPGGPFTIDLPRPDVAIRIRLVQHSILAFERIMDGVTDLARAGVPGADRIYSLGPDPEHDRVIILTDRLNDELLEAIATRFGTNVIAVRIDPRATPMHLL